MIVFISVFIVFALVMAAMAVGVMLGRAPIKGSCGGLGALGVARSCGCTETCRNQNEEQHCTGKQEITRR